MSEGRAFQEQYDALLAQFLRPLLEGGTARVGDPIAPAALAHFELAAASDAEVEHAVADALDAHLRALLPARRVPWPEPGALALACALHDLAFATDPSLDRPFARGARATVARWAAAHAARAGQPRTRGQALVRHALVDRFLLVRRRDVIVRNWAYSWRFLGRPVPPRYLAWRAVRRVKTSEQMRDLGAVLADAPDALGLPAVVRAVFAASPLTSLLGVHGAPAPAFDAASAAVLSDRALRGAVVRAHAADPHRAARLFGRALAQALALPSASARVVLEFVHELHVACLLGRDAVAPPIEDRATADLAALLPACALTEPGRALVGLHALDPRDQRLVEVAAQRTASQLPAESRGLAEALVAHALGAPDPRALSSVSVRPEVRP
jgi:hypothetical protein